MRPLSAAAFGGTWRATDTTIAGDAYRILETYGDDEAFKYGVYIVINDSGAAIFEPCFAEDGQLLIDGHEGFSAIGSAIAAIERHAE